MKQLKLSASMIADFKACPYRCYLKYFKNIRRDEDTEALRIGNMWHRGAEILGYTPATVCPECAKKGQKNESCALCEGTDILPDDLMEAVSRELNRLYEKIPGDLEVERIKVLYMLAGYKWYYQDDGLTVCRTEERFSIPLVKPGGTRAMPMVCIRGKIDKTVNEKSRELIIEHKTTTRAIDPDSTYWNRLNLDTQTLLYPFACRASGMEISGVIYDVMHKPTINPKKLTQADSKQFVEDGMYCDQKFLVEPRLLEKMIFVNHVSAEWEPGKKAGTFAIRETPEMYGARLLKDITERPEFYFARREIARTDDDLARFHRELMSIYVSLRMMDKADSWYKNEGQCEATFKCSYLNMCYNGIDPDTDQLPEGLIRYVPKEKK